MNDDINKIKEFENKLGLKFNNINLLKLALTHASYIVENKLNQYFDFSNNERLEFLGDSVLSIIVSFYLYNKYPLFHEGDLTKYRARLVSREMCFYLSKFLKLGDYLLLGSCEEKSNGREKFSNLANGLEAILGAIYLDKGLEEARKFLFKYLDKLDIDNDFIFEEDYKTKLQEIIQKKYKVVPTYKILKEYGPFHNKTFIIQVFVNELVLGEGRGENKKKAQQLAAKDALIKKIFI